MKKKFFFKKKYRLFKNYQFCFVFKKSHKVFNKKFLIFSRENYCKHPRLGIRISTKIIKFSYKRNIVKRIIRESFRKNIKKLFYMDFIVMVKNNISKVKNFYLFVSLQNLWERYFNYDQIL
ncbi:ribonuclease P protein component [Buchnera aphidicola (Pseudoregma panicola)]|uniref:ribonuclease P protein component n=1 Tax=Buchnera aphidicola TaxID=9 RepID=UPI0031B6984B